MLFNSPEFLLFLPIVFGLYWFVTQRSLKAQNLLLLVASYVFYGWWDWRFLGLIALSTIVDFLVGIRIEEAPKKARKKRWLWVSLAANLRILGAYLLGQMDYAETFQAQSQQVWNQYATELSSWTATNSISNPTIPAQREYPAHLFFLLLNDLDARTRFIQHMKAHDILTAFHFLPLEDFNYAHSKGWNTQHCPVSQSKSQCLVRLSLFTALNDKQFQQIAISSMKFTS